MYIVSNIYYSCGRNSIKCEQLCSAAKQISPNI